MDENNKMENKGLSEEYFQEENQTSTYTNNDTNNTTESWGNTSGNHYENPYGGSYSQNQYNSDRNYGQNDKKLGFGIASLVLGIISLVFFCSCLNVITGILAIIFGVLQLAKYKPHGKGLAIAGIVTAAISIILLVVFYGLVGSNAALQKSILDEYEDIYDYDFNDSEDVEQFLEDYSESL